MPKLIRWETPFTDSQFPSAIVMTGPDGDQIDLDAVIAPKGIDVYPKYIVHFGEVIAFSCMEEMHFPERDFAEAIREEEGLAANELLDSTWLKSYQKGEYFLFNRDGGKNERLRHFVILGGDNNIEVITRNTPIFEEVEDAKVAARAFVI